MKKGKVPMHANTNFPFEIITYAHFNVGGLCALLVSSSGLKFISLHNGGRTNFEQIYMPNIMISSTLNITIILLMTRKLFTFALLIEVAYANASA